MFEAKALTLLALGVLGIGVAKLLQSRWLHDLLRGNPPLERASDDVCAACGSTEVTPMAEAVYLCPDCGYEGGSGMAAFQWQQRTEALDKLDAEAARAHVAKLLADVALHLADAESSLEVAGEYYEKAAMVADGFDMDDRRRAEAQRASLRATAHEARGDAKLALMHTTGLLDEVRHLRGQGRWTPELDGGEGYLDKVAHLAGIVSEARLHLGASD